MDSKDGLRISEMAGEHATAYASIMSQLEQYFHSRPRPFPRHIYQELRGTTKIRLLVLRGRPSLQDYSKALRASRSWIADMVDQLILEETGIRPEPFDYDEAVRNDPRLRPDYEPARGPCIRNSAAYHSQWELKEADVVAKPEFEALSYSWMTTTGDSNKEWPIHLKDGSTIHVTRNLWQALHRLCPTIGVRIFWADQICIDQDNISERNQQLEIMKDIFQEANKTVLWLGEEDQASKDVNAFLHEVDKYKRLVAMKGEKVSRSEQSSPGYQN